MGARVRVRALPPRHVLAGGGRSGRDNLAWRGVAKQRAGPRRQVGVPPDRAGDRADVGGGLVEDTAIRRIGLQGSHREVPRASSASEHPFLLRAALPELPPLTQGLGSIVPSPS